MQIPQTQAAHYIQAHSDELDNHEVISILMAGALERIQQAKKYLRDEQAESGELAVNKLVGIVDGLRAMLDLKNGGEIAANLDVLYGYIHERLAPTIAENIQPENDLDSALVEVQKLIVEVKAGWDSMQFEKEALAS